MRLRGVVMLGALVVGASACGDAVAPAAHAASDLEFSAPTIRNGTATSDFHGAWDRPVTAEERQALLGESSAKAGGGTTASLEDDSFVLPMIISTFLAGEYVEDMVRIEYGMLGGGTGYTMTPFFQTTDASGAVIYSGKGMGRTEEAQAWFPFAVNEKEMVPIGKWCGTDTWATVRFEARSIRPPILGGGIAKTEQSDSEIIRQAECTAPGSGGGGSTVSVDNGFTVCFYEIWVDSYGNVVDVFFIGCRSYSGSNAY